MSRFMICINNGNNPTSLILSKVYRTLPIELPEAAERALMAAGD